MQLPWRSDEEEGTGTATAEREVAKPRTRRWRRIIGRPAATAPATAVPSVAPPDVVAPAAEAAPARHEPGFVAVTIARILIAINFALGGRR